jgi:hypothetical protein
MYCRLFGSIGRFQGVESNRGSFTAVQDDSALGRRRSAVVGIAVGLSPIRKLPLIKTNSNKETRVPGSQAAASEGTPAHFLYLSFMSYAAAIEQLNQMTPEFRLS